MFGLFLFLFLWCSVTKGIHFNGGTIRWEPSDPSINSSTVTISIIQSYSWTYPLITCANDVPITTSGRSTQNSNLTCVTDCSTDGGYYAKPINILTDCQSVSSSLGMMASQRSVNITLNANAHFYLAYVGSAWEPLNYPSQSGLQWSIITFIDLRMRADGFINTPPVASVVSPQYAIVNETTQIQIPVSDVNTGDTVRCRWSTYTSGYRRRRRWDEEEFINDKHVYQTYQKLIEDEEIVHIRKKRAKVKVDPCSTANCLTICGNKCSCKCASCASTSCSGKTCKINPVCLSGTTTIDTPGTLQSTSSYPHRQAIDECGGICYPSSVPNGTTLSNCTISFTGLIPDTWYAVALQVEDFINSTSVTPMSSVPVQFLIYVIPTPTCSLAPSIIPLNRCLQVQVNVSMSFSIYAMNQCNPNISYLTDIIVSTGITGMIAENLTDSLTNTSLSYVTFTWTPQPNQIGYQQLCTIAFTDEQVQSQQYCLTFNVITSSSTCITTTTSTTTTTTATTTTTSTTTTTTATTTSTSTTTTTTTTTTSKTTSTTSSTTTSDTTTTTSETTTITTTTSTATTTSVTTTTTTTTGTSTTTTTSTSTTSITETTTTRTTTIRTVTPVNHINWPLILGLSLLALLLALCCSCCCLYCLFGSPAAKRRRRRKAEEKGQRQSFLPRSILPSDLIKKSCTPSTNFETRKTYSPFYLLNTTNEDNSRRVPGKSSSINPSNTIRNAKQKSGLSKRFDKISEHVSVTKISNTEKPIENGNVPNQRNSNPSIQFSMTTFHSIKRLKTNETQNKLTKINASERKVRSLLTSSYKTDTVIVTKLPRNKRAINQRSRSASISNINIKQNSFQIQTGLNNHSNQINGVTVIKLKRLSIQH